MLCILSAGPPGAPSKPDAKNEAEDSIKLEWEPPVKDGGKPIKGYVVERREKGSPKWTKALMAQVSPTTIL